MSIIPDPGPPPGVTPTTTATSIPSGTFTIASGTQIYSIALMELFWINGTDAEFVNNGVVWMDAPPQPTDGSQAIEYRVLLNNIAFFEDVSIVNNGLIYIGGGGNVDIGGWTRYTRTSLVNTGSIFTVSENFQARVFTSDQSLYLENSGVIAAQTLGDDSVSLGAGQAFAIEAGIGHARNQIINHAGGQILAEAPNLAIALLIHGVDTAPDKPVVSNAGLIEAAATDPLGSSFGIYLYNYDGTPSTIVNSGTIRSPNFAIWGTKALGAVQNPVEVIINQAGGQIFGAVALNSGDDIFQNDGAVTGPVQMGFDDDHFFGTGLVNGWTDMGWGIDLFEGSANSDRAAGGRDADMLHGAGGGDLLLGGFGDDELFGGSGNDGLIGEWGDDTIHTQGGDYVEGGTDQDRIVLGDYSFEKAIGGAGFDVLAMAAGARDFSLEQMVLGGRVSGFEAIELQASQQLAVSAGSIGSLTGGGTTLWVDSAASNTVHLAGAWVRGADVDYQGTAYETWTQGAYTVFVSEASTVTLNSAPAFGGFDAVAGGTAALRPGAAAGLDYTDPVFLMTGLEIFPSTDGKFTVHANEIFYSPSPGAILYSYSVSLFTNNGAIYAYGETGPAAGPIIHNADEFINNGLIYVETSGDPYYSDPFVATVGASANYSLTNHGDLQVYSQHGPALGVDEAGRAINSGQISVISDAGQAIALEGVSGRNEFVPDVPGQRVFDNTGVIYAEGNGPKYSFVFNGNFDELLYHSAAAVGVRGVGSLTNDGLIVAALGANAGTDDFTIGVFTYHHSGAPQTGIVNNGEISGTYAIVFGRDSTASNYVDNNGLITGDILFFNGDDAYDGSGGEIDGTVFGFGGNDSFIGGAGNDSFDGGAGIDTMAGGLGNDTYLIDSLADVVSEAAAGGTDTLVSPFDTYLDSYANLENLTLAGSGNFFAVGNAAANLITGNSGANLLIGGEGDDTLIGGDGGDALFGEAGIDTLYGGAGIDYLVGGADKDALYGGADADALYGEDGGDTLDGGEGFVTDILVGGAGNDTLYANSGLNDYDLIDGGSGDDSYYVDTGADLTFEAADGGTDTVHADVSNVPNAGVYLYANVENLVLVGTTAFGVGNELANTLTGSASGNWLLGGAGNDTINGKEGNDVLFGEAGADSFVFEPGSGADVIGDFNAAEDVINLDAYNFASFAALQANFVQVGNDGAIDLGGGNLIVLHNVTMASLDAGDFVL